MEQLVELTGRVPEGASQIAREDRGWCVTLEVVELERVPRSTDVIGCYEVLLDSRGQLIAYRRVGRYVRSQVTDE